MIRIGYMKALPAALAAVGLFAGAAYAQGNSTVQSNSMGGPNATNTARDIPSATGRSESHAKSNLSHSDRKFIEDAAKGGMAEVELAKIAQERASSPEVKQFAQQTAPTLEHHLQMAESADAAVGGKQAKNAARNDKQAKNNAAKNADKTSRR
jgi:predicted outer membrane protein